MRTNINFKKLHNADLIIDSSVFSVSEQQQNEFSIFLKNRKKVKIGLLKQKSEVPISV